MSGIDILTALPARAILSFFKSSDQDVQCEGWLLKKRQRKQQGFARRYFTLRASGILSYALHPQLTPHEQISLHSATISSSSPRREIHIDCESGTCHVKATSMSDFEMWMAAFRKFIHVATEVATFSKKLSLRGSLNLSTDANINNVNKTLDEMDLTIKSIDDTLRSSKSNGQSKKLGKFRKDGGGGKDREGLKNLFRRSSNASSEPDSPMSSTMDHLIQSIETLRTQFECLRKLLAPVENNLPMSPISPIRSPRPQIPSMIEEHPARKDSIGTVMSGDTSAANVWFDAPEGPEEVVIQDDDTATDYSANDHVEEMLTVDVEKIGNEKNDMDHMDDDLHASVIRRTILPAPITGDEVSLFAFLKKNIGKDLSTVSFPVTANEPLGLLQRLAEEMEYIDLISQACAKTDAVERMCLVAAFAVSGFACTKLRSSRKPFTPMLGETFEDIRTRFVAEKVSHHPLVIACHAEGNGWELWGTNAGKNHFWGKSLEFEPTGATHLRIGEDHFQWTRPSSFVRNLVMGTKYLEHTGSLTIENSTTGARCVIEFREAGLFGTPNVVAGTVYSPGGKVATRLEGTWHEQLSQVVSKSHLRVLWRANPFPKHAPQYYGLSSFATTLNEITKDIEGKLPPNDTRYRPDLRALEEGNVAVAEKEKVRVEEAQRERRRNGAEVQPSWFEKVGPEEYAYKGGYWEQRAKGWAGYPHLW